MNTFHGDKSAASGSETGIDHELVDHRQPAPYENEDNNDSDLEANIVEECESLYDTKQEEIENGEELRRLGTTQEPSQPEWMPFGLQNFAGVEDVQRYVDLAEEAHKEMLRE